MINRCPFCPDFHALSGRYRACPFCPMVGFLTFEDLDRHVMGDCQGCEDPMAKDRQAREDREDRGGRGQSRGRGRGRGNDRLPRLTLEVLGKDREMSVKLNEHVTTVDAEFGTSELFHVTAKGEQYSWFIRRRSGNFKILKRIYGRDPERWEGKTVEVERATFDSDDKGAVPYLAIVED